LQMQKEQDDAAAAARQDALDELKACLRAALESLEAHVL